MLDKSTHVTHGIEASTQGHEKRQITQQELDECVKRRSSKMEQWIREITSYVFRPIR